MKKLCRLNAIALLILLALVAGQSPGAVILAQGIDAPPPILADGQFVYGPNVGRFQMANFLQARGSPLASYASMLDDKASYYSINPRVLLTILEMRSNSVTRGDADLGEAIGYPAITSLDEEVEELLERLAGVFYARLYGDLATIGMLTITLRTGEVVAVPGSAKAGTLAVLTSLAPLSSLEQWNAILLPDSSAGFVATYRRLFPESDPLDDSNDITPDMAPPADLLKMPFECNDTWYFSGGPHEYDGCDGAHVRSAVDFAPGVANCAIPTNRWITAPAAGTVGTVNCGGCQVYINYTGGWGVRFYHVANPQVSQGQLVAQDQRIGNPSCKPAQGGSCGGCSGTAYGTHAHIDLLYNGSFVAIEGAAFEGWVVHGTTCYNGYLERGGEQRWKGSSINSACSDSVAPTISFSPSNPPTNQWYNTAQTIAWTVSDTGGSGVRGFKYAWDQNPPGGSEQPGASGSAGLSAAGQGQHTLYVQAWDNAGNASAVAAAGWFGYDTLPPSNPTSVSPGCAAANNAWQNSCNDPSFTWSGASDGSGSGVKDYHYYWGDSPSGALTTYTANTAYDPPAVPSPVAVYYLRMATRDNLNQEGTPAALFVLRYDASPPTAAVLVNNGALTTTQVDVTLHLAASDTGSGVGQVRASNNNVEWSPWQPYAAELPWTLPALNRRELPVYVQVRDRAGNESDVVSDTIFLDFYPPPPHGANYRICGDVWDAAGGRLTSANYLVHFALGQPAQGSPESAGYTHDGGFLAMDGCLPITIPPTLNFTVTQWVIAAGGNLRASGSYRVGDTAGEPAASAADAFSSTNYVLSSGFWASGGGMVPPPPPTGTVTPTPRPPTPTPATTPTPTPTPPPGNFGIQINGSDLYTNDRVVTVTARAPNVTHMRLSNDSVFQDNGWFSYRLTSTWVLSATGEPLRTVYAWFRDAESTVYGPYLDDITYDPDPPVGGVQVLGGGEITVTLWLYAYDDLSGVDVMRVSDTVTLTLVPWQPYAQILPWVLHEPVVYAQYRDRAGNESVVYSSEEGGGVLYRIYLPLVMRND